VIHGVRALVTERPVEVHPPEPPPNHGQHTQETAMYAMYPDPMEWGPANRDPENPYGQSAVQRAIDLRDSGGPMPDDN
jgi:hypothetical protein